MGGELRKEGWEVRREKSLSSSLGDGGLNGSRANAAGAAHEGNEEIQEWGPKAEEEWCWLVKCQ